LPTFTPDPGWLPYHPAPTKPTYAPPPGAVDAHCHVFGPGDAFPYAPERKYTPTDAGKDALFALRDFLGFERQVIVQATCHGADNSALVDALRTANDGTANDRTANDRTAKDGTANDRTANDRTANDGADRARGVVTIRAGVAPAELAELHDAGVRGIRFNFVRRLADPKPDAHYRALVDLVAGMGWHVVLYFEAADLAANWDLFTSFPCPVVVDHMGRPDVSKPVDGPEFALFLRFLEEHGNVWSKVSCPERLTVSGPPGYADVLPFARTVVERFPDRVLWGTDWPHPNMKSHMPDDGLLLDLVPLIAPTEDLRRRLLVDNPTRLYWAA
jgi:2-pyrone-4,6-dicarboxylate lactonase